MRKLILFILVSIFLTNQLQSSSINNKSIAKIIFKDKPSLILEIANTKSQRSIGLMNRRSLEKYTGMLFDYKGLYQVKIWMKNTFIPLDIIFLNKNEIVYIKKNALPCLELSSSCPTFSAEKPVDSVIEVNAGIVDEYNFKIGDKIMYQLINN